jgi:hypothetical protein
MLEKLTQGLPLFLIHEHPVHPERIITIRQVDMETVACYELSHFVTSHTCAVRPYGVGIVIAVRVSRPASSSSENADRTRDGEHFPNRRASASNCASQRVFAKRLMTSA